MHDEVAMQAQPEVAESQIQLTVKAHPDLLGHEQYQLIRDTHETNAEYASRNALFGALLDHARQG